MDISKSGSEVHEQRLRIDVPPNILPENGRIPTAMRRLQRAKEEKYFGGAFRNG